MAVLEVTGDAAQIGFDQPFSILVHFRSAGGRQDGALPAGHKPADVRWTQIGGPALRDVAVTEGGLRFSARTPRLSDCREGALPWGVVPFSPRTRGEVVLQA
jgi:hypothetical protein